MSLKIFDSIVPAGDYPVALAKYIKTDDGKSLEDALKNVDTQTVHIEEIEGGIRITLTDENGEQSFDVMEGSGEVTLPVFDLGALGLTPISIYGGMGGLETDTTEIIAAFEKGPVVFVVPVDVSEQITNATIVMNPSSVAGSYQSVALINFAELATVTVNVGTGMLSVSIEPLALEQEEETKSSTVDLTAFETDGIITETFADGEQNIYTFTYDEATDTTTIVDSKGNTTDIKGLNTGLAQAEEVGF